MKSNSNTRQVPAKHIPERTCISCRQVKEKRELVRVVRSPGGIMVDEKGKVSGRGAYLCKNKQCWEEGLKGNRLEYVLRTRMSQEDRTRLEQYTSGI